MKNIYILFCFLSVTLFSQTPNLSWINSIGGTLGDEVSTIACDASGNCYIAGYFGSVVDFDPSPATAALTGGNKDIFIAKYNSLGQYQWAKRLASTSTDQATKILIDATGVYLCGYTSSNSSMDFDPSALTFTLQAYGGLDGFIAKYTTSGNFIWATRYGGGFDDYVNDICLDGSGNLYAIGSFSSTVDFDPSPLTVINKTSNGWIDAFVAKYNCTNGQLNWVENLGGLGDDYGEAVEFNQVTNNLVVGGTFERTVDFDFSASVTTMTATGLGPGDVFIANYQANSTFQNAVSFGNLQQEFVDDLGIDNLGNVYITGGYQGSVDFNPGPLTDIKTNNGLTDVFLSKFSGFLNYQWANTFGTSNFDYGLDLGFDSGNNVFVCGVCGLKVY